MNQSDLAKEVAEEAGISHTKAAEAVKCAFSIIGNAMRNKDEVRIQGFGIFASKHKDARTGRNPHSGEAVDIAAKDVPHFKPSTALKELVNTPVRRRR